MKPSAWIERRMGEINENWMWTSEPPERRELIVRQMAIVDYLDSRHDAQLEAEQRFRESEQELPYG